IVKRGVIVPATHRVRRADLDALVPDAGDVKGDLALAVKYPDPFVQAPRADHLPVHVQQRLFVQIDAGIVDLVRRPQICCHTVLLKTQSTERVIKDVGEQGGPPAGGDGGLRGAGWPASQIIYNKDAKKD